MKTTLIALLFATALTPLRHNRLIKAEPGVEATVAASPSQIRLWFKEPPELAMSGITLADAAGKPVATGAVKATDDKTSISVPLPSPLAKGTYMVTWKTAGTDGHVIRGSFGFIVGS